MTGFDRFFKSVNNRYKRTDYDYDLQSGKVNYVYYENDSLDAFTQWYQYDQDLRLSNVMTSLDQVQWDDDASYYYYNHGPLSRMELGRREVQGVDYAYTINGWLKGINSSTGLVKNDMGADGIATNIEGHSMFASDVYGVVLGYYSGDYKPIKNPTQPFELAYAGSNFDVASPGLYNGNIRNTTVSLRGKIYYGDTDVSMSPIGYAYNYDQLNRYVSMRAYNNYDTSTNTWQRGGAALQDYAENVNYDGNGNILAYIRHGNPTIGTPTGLTAMDSMTYSYNSNNNQLNSVADGVSSSNYSNDIDNEVGDNYKYDKQGNMIFDSSQHLTITWNVRNKVATVYNDSKKLLITFGYDAMGNRIMKQDSNLSSHKSYTLWYERDAQGNVLSLYKERNDSLWWQEADIYGSSRVGVYYADSLIYPKGFQITTDTFKMELWEGKRQYELTNNTGGVLSTISDKKIMLASNAYYSGGGAGARAAYRTISGYQAEVVNIDDYGAYGNILTGRNFSLANDTAFRYGFNGQEKDDDIEGKGDLNTAEYWEYDTRLGRRWNLDPEPNAYESNYSAFLDNPIWHTDMNGNSPGGCCDGPVGNNSKQAQQFGGIWTAASSSTATADTPYQAPQAPPASITNHPVLRPYTTTPWGQAIYDEEGKKAEDEKNPVTKIIHVATSASTYVKIAGAGTAVIGAVTAQPEIVAGGAELFTAGDIASNVTTALEIGNDVRLGDYSDAAIAGGFGILGGLAGSRIDAIKGLNSVAKDAFKVTSDVALDKIQGSMIGSSTPAFKQQLFPTNSGSSSSGTGSSSGSAGGIGGSTNNSGSTTSGTSTPHFASTPTPTN